MSMIPLVPLQLARDVEDDAFPNAHAYLKQRISACGVKCDLHNAYHSNYLTQRRNGIDNVKELCRIFKLTRSVMHKTVLYMDSVFFNAKCKFNVDIVYQVSTVLVVFAVQFNECCFDREMNDMFYLLKMIPQYNELEIELLKLLSYDLNRTTAYDFVMMLFKNGIAFINEHEHEHVHETEEISFIQRNVNYAYDVCLTLIDYFVSDDIFVDFNAFEFAVITVDVVMRSVLKMGRTVGYSGKAYYNKKLLLQMYGVDLNTNKYVKCRCVLSHVFDYMWKHTSTLHIGKYLICVDEKEQQHSDTTNKKNNVYQSDEHDMLSGSTIDTYCQSSC